MIESAIRNWMLKGAAPAEEWLRAEGNALHVDGWWPLVVALDPSVFLLRVDEDCPRSDLPEVVSALLTEEGFRPVPADSAVVESIALQRLGLLGARWQMWGTDETNTRRVVEAAAAGADDASI